MWIWDIRKVGNSRCVPHPTSPRRLRTEPRTARRAPHLPCRGSASDALAASGWGSFPPPPHSRLCQINFSIIKVAGSVEPRYSPPATPSPSSVSIGRCLITLTVRQVVDFSGSGGDNGRQVRVVATFNTETGRCCRACAVGFEAVHRRRLLRAQDGSLVSVTVTDDDVTTKSSQPAAAVHADAQVMARLGWPEEIPNADAYTAVDLVDSLAHRGSHATRQ